jgi:hypothetical protein
VKGGAHEHGEVAAAVGEAGGVFAVDADGGLGMGVSDFGQGADVVDVTVGEGDGGETGASVLNGGEQAVGFVAGVDEQGLVALGDEVESGRASGREGEFDIV